MVSRFVCPLAFCALFQWLTLAWQAEVTEHSGKVDRARHMEKKMTEAFRKRVQATQGVVTAEEEDIKLQGFKESVNELLSAVLSPDPRLERQRKRELLAGDLPSPLDPRAQLTFLKSRLDQPDYRPRLIEEAPGHFVAEHD